MVDKLINDMGKDSKLTSKVLSIIVDEMNQDYELATYLKRLTFANLGSQQEYIIKGLEADSEIDVSIKENYDNRFLKFEITYGNGNNDYINVKLADLNITDLINTYNDAVFETLHEQNIWKCDTEKTKTINSVKESNTMITEVLKRFKEDKEFGEKVLEMVAESLTQDVDAVSYLKSLEPFNRSVVPHYIVDWVETFRDTRQITASVMDKGKLKLKYSGTGDTKVLNAEDLRMDNLLERYEEKIVEKLVKAGLLEDQTVIDDVEIETVKVVTSKDALVRVLGLERDTKNRLAFSKDGKVVVKRANGDYVEYAGGKIKNHTTNVSDNKGQIRVVGASSVEINDIVLRQGDFYQVTVKKGSEITAVKLESGDIVKFVQEVGLLGINVFNVVKQVSEVAENRVKDMLQVATIHEDYSGLEAYVRCLVITNYEKDKDIEPLMLLSELMTDNELTTDDILIEAAYKSKSTIDETKSNLLEAVVRKELTDVAVTNKSLLKAYIEQEGLSLSVTE